MKIAGIRELRSHLRSTLGGEEPVLVTRHGKISGLYLPLEEPDRLPLDLRRELSAVLGRHLAQQLATQGVGEAEVQRAFDAHRRRRR
jgi:hypothetical protein